MISSCTLHFAKVQELALCKFQFVYRKSCFIRRQVRLHDSDIPVESMSSKINLKKTDSDKKYTIHLRPQDLRLIETKRLCLEQGQL